MILDEKTSILRGFSELALPRLAQGSKKNDEGIIYNISNKEKIQTCSTQKFFCEASTKYVPI